MSNNETIVQVEGLGKRYLIGHENAKVERYTALRDVVVRQARNLARKTLDMARGRQIVQGDEVEEFWALKDVSFEVKRGEVLGIIGRNGAGKSTLLKILSRITEPSEGRVRMKGRVASLLEVGTGFHPELTGRENIFLNGAILGMSRKEIKNRFDEIVAFAEVERFLDTPVKRYSSGMYVRLAFAVAAHLEPEILIVDEVLAVGDAEFQKKCLGKMKDVAKGGRTVLFVSHQLSTLRQLCKRGVLLQCGQVAFQGCIGSALDAYLSRKGSDHHEAIFPANPKKPIITRVAINTERLRMGDLVVEIDYESPFRLSPPVPGLLISSASGDPVYGSNIRMHPPVTSLQPASHGRIAFHSEQLPLMAGRYSLSVWLGEWHQDYDSKLGVLEFEFREGQRNPQAPPPSMVGYLDCEGLWRTSHVSI